MAEFNFKVLQKAWQKLLHRHLDDLKKVAPDLSDPTEIYLKRIEEDGENLWVQFTGFEDSVFDKTAVPQIKRAIQGWLKRFSMSVQSVRGDNNTMTVKISKQMKMGEAVIGIYKRDPKTNQIKNYFKCIGGKKDGRRVANPNNCLGVPDFSKRMSLAKTKRAKPAQAKLGRKKTQLTNIVSKRLRKANTRLKKARGF